ncbi:MAG TPA: sugar phosphate nucleotidyltransferase [Bacteroidales bacterium]|nr:sugar phosphate nucleotidyltransferase [Bacteroidales bacterium]HPS18171.1 sugar phosphate nucleotidyltransferase [Bacteroidales bacterium]
MKAVILAGGKGTRLKPYTTSIPKPLVPIGEKAIIDILINRLKNAGVDEVFICVNHLAEIIMAFLGDGKKFGIKINYSFEKKPLSTIAPLKLIKNLPDDFLVMNGDLLTDLDFKKLFLNHIKSKAQLTVSTYKRKVKIDFGVIEVDKKGSNAVGFLEKPEYNYEVAMGVNVINKKLLKLIPEDTSFGFDNLMNMMLKKNEKINIFRYNGYWLDIGRPDDYEKANNDVEKLKHLLK